MDDRRHPSFASAMRLRAGENAARSIPSEAGIEAEDEAERIAAADHHDPFSYLGMHFDPAVGSLVVRVFAPDARQVFVVDPAIPGSGVELPRSHPAGLFAGPIGGRSQRLAYRLHIVSDGGVREIEDPFRFPPVLGDIDLHLPGEGRHLRSYKSLARTP